MYSYYYQIINIKYTKTSRLMNQFFYTISILISIAILNNTADAQIINKDSIIATAVNTDIDVKDVYKKIFNKKDKMDTAIIKKKYYTTILPGFGYSLQTKIAATIGVSIAFKTEPTSKKGLSNISSSLTYTEYNQFLFPISANIWAKKDKYNIIIDYRFLKYPSTNYGIGSRTTDNDAYTLTYNYIKLHQTILRRIYKELYGGIGIYYDCFWNITEVDSPNGVKTSFQRYENKDKETAVGIAPRLAYDDRDNQLNPLKGTLVNIIFRPDYTFLGSDNNWQSLQIEYRKYLKLSVHSNNILALWSYNWITIGKGKTPYLLLPSTGWDDQYNTGRGYIQGRFRAKNMIYAEAEYRFKILQNSLIGGVLFANAASFSGKISNQLSVIEPGIGLGLRIKLNKNSNTNLCIDYGFGQNGSSGLFLNLGEVF